MAENTFPKNFCWGVSTSAYQTEDAGLGVNDPYYFNTDWDLFYAAGHLKESKGEGTKSFSCFERDVRALKKLNVSHYRFGVEWARIEPKPGVYNPAAIAHYAQLAKRLVEEGIEPIVALWHFTFPDWLTNLKRKSQHGWLHPKAMVHWPLYVEKTVEALSPWVSYFAPQNEPNTQSLTGFLTSLWPPAAGFKPALYYENMRIAAEAYKIAAKIIRHTNPNARVVSIQNLIHWQKSPYDFFKIFFRFAKDFNYFHLNRVAAFTDIIGFTYYMGETASPYMLMTQHRRSSENTSDLFWPMDPGGLRHLIEVLTKKYRKPIMIMENGVADHTDLKRQRYLRDHLQAVRAAIRDGHDVRGYFHWSLLDNYEWAYGYSPKFGLFGYDNQQAELISKPSAQLYRELITQFKEGLAL